MYCNFLSWLILCHMVTFENLINLKKSISLNLVEAGCYSSVQTVVFVCVLYHFVRQPFPVVILSLATDEENCPRQSDCPGLQCSSNICNPAKNICVCPPGHSLAADNTTWVLLPSGVVLCNRCIYCVSGSGCIRSGTWVMGRTYTRRSVCGAHFSKASLAFAWSRVVLPYTCYMHMNLFSKWQTKLHMWRNIIAVQFIERNHKWVLSTWSRSLKWDSACW